MSNFYALTIHPETKILEMAEWLDDHFGRHRYGVRFPSDGNIYREGSCIIVVQDSKQAMDAEKDESK